MSAMSPNESLSLPFYNLTTYVCIQQTFFLFLHVLHKIHTHMHRHTILYYLYFSVTRFILLNCSSGLFTFTAIFYRTDIPQISDPFSIENLLGCF